MIAAVADRAAHGLLGDPMPRGEHLAVNDSCSLEKGDVGRDAALGSGFFVLLLRPNCADRLPQFFVRCVGRASGLGN
jgi:hypothetical protein